MAQPDDGRGNLYEQVLEYAKREMDEAASKMNDIKQSLELLEARVEAAKAVYQAVASRLNLEDEADGSGFQASFPDVPAHVPEPPLTVTPAPEAAAPAPPVDVAETPAPEPINGNGTPHTDQSKPVSDLDLIRQHLADKAENIEAPEPAAPVEPAPAPAPAPVQAEAPAPVEDVPAPAAETAPLAKPPTADEDDSFSMRLIRQHLEQKSQEKDTPPPAPYPAEPAPAEPAPASMADIVAASPPDAEPEPAEKEPASGGSGLSEADRELIGAYLRSKQN